MRDVSFDAARYAATLAAVAAERRASAVSEAHGWTDEQIAALPDSPDGVRLRRLIAELQAEPEPGRDRLQRLIVAARQPSGRGVAAIPVSEASGEGLPTFPSGLVGPDGPIPWGGVVLVAGTTGTGKSKLAMRASTLAAIGDPHRLVVYLNAELDLDTIALYYAQATGLDPANAERDVPGWMHVEVTPAATFDRVLDLLVDLVAEHPHEIDRLLVVVDTVNTFAEKAFVQDHPGAIFEALREVGLWSMEARRLSHGDIAVMLVSEQNRRGEVFGAKLDKWADCVLLLNPTEDVEGWVDMKLAKARYWRAGDLGSWRRDWARCTFEHPNARLAPAEPREPDADEEPVL